MRISDWSSDVCSSDLDAVYDAVFARAGMLRVYSLEELFDAAETLSHYAAAGGEDAGEARLAMVTNGGGLGVLATDALVDEGGKLAELAPETIAALDRSEEHTSEIQSLMRISYAVFCLKKKKSQH